MARDLLSVREVAEKHGISVWRVHQLIQAGTLAAEKYGNQYLIKLKDVEKMVVYRKPGRPPKKND